MAIASKHKGGGNFIKVPGEYVVEVVECKVGKSKKGQPMLTVAFQNFNQEKIAGYYVKGLKFHENALADLKVACGLTAQQSADDLVGKSCGILVEAGDTDDNGRTFMQITGYGPANAVTGHTDGPSNYQAEEDIKF